MNKAGGNKFEKRKITAVLLAMTMMFSILPINVAFADNIGDGYRLCEHHREHNDDCTDNDAHECEYICQVCLEEAQELIDALPSIGELTKDDVDEVKAALDEIDTAKLNLSQAGRDLPDYTKCDAVVFFAYMPPGYFGGVMTKSWSLESTTLSAVPTFKFVDEQGGYTDVIYADLTAHEEVTVDEYGDSEYFYLPEGTVDGGALVYSLDGNDYSENIPTGTDSKAYTVYYKVIGDENHNDWKNPFGDVSENDWFYENVKYVHQNGLMNGITNSTSVPYGNLTRAMLVTILYRAEGEPAVSGDIPFKDVDENAYYAAAVAWAESNGIVQGVSDTEFAPEENITREQIAAIMFRYAKYKGYDVSVGENTNILSYTDFDEISEYATETMQYAVGSGLINSNTDETLNPKDNATRAEFAAILQRFIEGNK